MKYIKCTGSGPMGGDCTSSYSFEVIDKNNLPTVGQIVEDALSNKGEWGRIEIPEIKDSEGWSGICVGYQNGKLNGANFEPSVLERKVKRVSGHGGWSAMDYTLTLAKSKEEEEKEELEEKLKIFQTAYSILRDKIKIENNEIKLLVTNDEGWMKYFSAGKFDAGQLLMIQRADGYRNGVDYYE